LLWGYHSQAVAARPAAAARHSSHARALALLGAADEERLHGNVVDAAAVASLALEAFTSLGDPIGAADALTTLGAIETSAGDLAAANRHHADALTRYEIARRNDGCVNALRGLAEVARREGRLEMATALLDEALRRSAVTGYRLGEANVRLSLAAVLLGTGRLADASEQVDTALDIYRTELNDRIGEATANMWRGEVAEAAGLREVAATSYERARTLFRADADPLGQASATFRLAAVSDGSFAGALYAEAAALFARAGLAQWSIEARAQGH
jgi:tetratricopeptide (TPR) repeat protein